MENKNMAKSSIKDFCKQPETHEYRVTTIAADILKGAKKSDIISKYEKEWGLDTHYIWGLYKAALSYLYNKSQINIEDIKKTNLERLEAIMDRDDVAVKDILKAIDLSNRTAGVYTDKIEVKTNDTIHFEFPDVETNLNEEQAEQEAELQNQCES